MGNYGFAFNDTIPIERFQGAEIEGLFVGSISVTLQLNNDRYIVLDYQGCVEERESWLCKLPLCGEQSLMSLYGQSIKVEFCSYDRAIIQLSGGGTIELVRDKPGMDLVRFGIGEDQYQA